MDEKQLLDIVTDNAQFDGAYNIRVNGKLLDRKINDQVDIITKQDVSGIDIVVKPNTKNQTIGIPVVLTAGDISDKVYNDFYVGENSKITVVAGCGIDNCSTCDSSHDGIHTFHIGKGASVTYIERHFGHGDGSGKRILNPETVVYLDKDASMTLNTTQIEGVDSSVRLTKAVLGENANLVINEKVMTDKNQYTKSEFYLQLNEPGSTAKLSSRVVAKDNSNQEFFSDVQGNAECFAHVECDAIIMGNAKVNSVPKIQANCSDARLVHEATIGKIAGEQLVKLLTLGLTEAEAEKAIINGFLK